MAFQKAKRYFMDHFDIGKNPFHAYIRASTTEPVVMDNLVKFFNKLNSDSLMLPPLPVLPKIDDESPLITLLGNYYVVKAPLFMRAAANKNESPNIQYEKLIQWANDDKEYYLKKSCKTRS